MTFVIIAISSTQIGELFSRIRLPKITGFLFTGLIVGPFVLGLLTEETVHNLLFVDEISLAIIAFAAGSELYLPELRGKLRSISWVTAGLVTVTLIFGTTAIYFLSGSIPFLAGMSNGQRFAIGLLTSSILVARSPSSAIAIINELRAKGTFTQIVLGVTVIMDVVVIIVFAISSSIADAFLTQVPISLNFLLLIFLDLTLAAGLAFLVYLLLNTLLKINIPRYMKSLMILAIGYGVFLFSTWFREWTHATMPFEILVEPLLVCMVASFLVNNNSLQRIEYLQILHDIGPFVYVAFFTLTGAALELDVLAQTWQIAVALYFVRMISIMIGSYLGGTIAGNPPLHNRLRWMGFITQAGVALGLAKEVAVEFPELGNAFATMVISVVVLNEISGPLFFKWVINRVGEAHTRAKAAEFDGVRDAVIFGLTPQGIALARQLQSHGWNAKIATQDKSLIEELAVPDVVMEATPDFSLESMQKLEMDKADGVVLMLSDEENCQVCETIYESYGIENVVAYIQDRACVPRLKEIGALTVDRETAVVSLLDHFVRSPSVTSVLIGEDQTQDIIEVEVRDPSLHGKLIRDISLPLDVLLLSVKRNRQMLVIHGYTRLEMGDRVTMVGSPEKLEEVTLRFDA